MKTLLEIKDEVVKVYSYSDWDEFKKLTRNISTDKTYVILDIVAKRYAEEALKEAAEIIENKEYNAWDKTSIKEAEGTKQSILNLIKELK